MEHPFVQAFRSVQEDTFATSIAKGWDECRNHGESIALMHEELSEALRSQREHNPPSKKIPDFTCSEEELADVIIRIMNYAKANNFRVAEALIAKAEHNKTRPHRHGGLAF